MLEDAPRCTFIKITGHPCQSPALKNKNFCYFHERATRRVAIPYETTIEPQFILDNQESIQYAIMETLTAIVRGTMDHKTASLVLRGLNIAVRNCRGKNVSFDQSRNTMVREVPNYARQYLLEHPELGEPITDAEVQAQPKLSDELPQPEVTQAAPVEPSAPEPELSEQSEAPAPIPPSPDHEPAMIQPTEMATIQASATTTLSACQPSVPVRRGVAFFVWISAPASSQPDFLTSMCPLLMRASRHGCGCTAGPSTT
jgi:hypothetical protein